VLYPQVADPGDAYLTAVVQLLPPGLTGLLVAAFAAAYMSTISTHLNWGASYLVNDVYQRFVDPDAPQKKLVGVSRLVTAALFLLSSGVTYLLYLFGSIEGAWRVLIALGAGTGLVYILRWYWWRINAWSEISAMIAAFVTFVILTAAGVFDPIDPRESALLTLVTTGVTTVVWIAVTFLTMPTPDATLIAFYRRVRPGGPGWRRVSEAAGFGREAIAGGALSWINWVAGVVCVYASLFGVGRLILGPRIEGVIYLLIAAGAFAWIGWSLRSDPWGRAPVEPARGAAAVEV
jgi:hypothetical protein